MKGLGLRLYTLATVVGFGLTWASGVLLALIGFTGNPQDCTSSCFLGAVPGAVGWVLVLVCGHRALFGYLSLAGVNTSKREEHLQAGSTQEDGQILETAKELLSNRRIQRLRPVDTLAWSDRQAWYAPPLRGAGLGKPSRIVLSAGLRGRIDIQDWRTLLAYYFQQYGSARNTLCVLRGFAKIWLLVGVSFSIGAILSLTLGRYVSSLFATTVGPLVSLAVLFQLGPAIRNTLLTVDAAITKSMNTGKLLACFERIDRLQLPEIESAKKREGWVAHLWPMPNITQRIDNLQKKVRT